MSHDSRQPLGALRLSIKGMARDAPQEAQDAPRQDMADQTYPSPVSLVQESVGQMFSDEARAKGLDQRIFPRSAQMRVPTLQLMRTLSNLVSNVVKSTDQGRALWVSA
ncbi:hypothetical protein [Antarctobacter sp.]|uniref:hypothetical protein n=1 Tax=Antarctobacter sp. TaxID=1872577 RepID=UPI002B272ED1|nr:hypothetical protein [Antarctobacter sp.]